MEYRCNGNGAKWHFCSNCPKWPLNDFDAFSFPSLSSDRFDLCESCTALQERGECHCVIPERRLNFRDHPALIRNGLMLWPPQWSNTYQAKEIWPQGEIGTLEKVWMDELLDRCVFLHMRDDVFRYIGAIHFDDRVSCTMVFNFLKSVVGRSVAEIGDLDISHLL